MEGQRVLKRIWLRNLLSFGSGGQALELEPLNVLIGPNGSGKSNLLARLDDWLERYPLGELWRSGELGGNRW